MKDFINKFERRSDGSWVCVSFAEITTVMGRIQVTEGTRFMPGTVFMAVDIVRLLEQEREAEVMKSLPPQRFSRLESKPKRSGEPFVDPGQPARPLNTREA